MDAVNMLQKGGNMHTIWHQVYLQKNGNYSGFEDTTYDPG